MDKRYLIIFGIFFMISFISAVLQISNISIEPENPTISNNIKICANVTSDSKISIVRLNLRRETPLWNWGIIMDKENDLYCKTLSPNLMKVWKISEDKTISYYISARNELGETATTKTYYFTYQEEPSIFCGDRTCNEDENCSTCPQDCGECETTHPNQTQKYNSNKKNFIQICDSNWKCSLWSSCFNGIKTRQCHDTNNCKVSHNKPIEETSCTTEISFKENKISWFFILTSLLIFVLLIWILVVLLKK